MDVFFFFFYDEDIDATVQASIDDTDIPQNELEFFYDVKSGRFGINNRKNGISPLLMYARFLLTALMVENTGIN